MRVFGALASHRTFAAAKLGLAVMAGAGVLVLAACGGSEPAAPAPAAAEVTPSPPAPPSPPEVDTLKALVTPLAPLQWSFVEGGKVGKAADAAPSAESTFVPFVLTATAEGTLHRLGAALPPVEAAKDYVVTVWVKAAPGTDAYLELAALDSGNAVTSYGVSFFDMAGAMPVPSPVATPEQQMKGAKLGADGEWIKLSGPLKVGANNTGSIVVGLAKEGSHVFAGTGAESLTVGGIGLAAK